MDPDQIRQKRLAKLAAGGRVSNDAASAGAATVSPSSSQPAAAAAEVSSVTPAVSKPKAVVSPIKAASPAVAATPSVNTSASHTASSSASASKSQPLQRTRGSSGTPTAGGLSSELVAFFEAPDQDWLDRTLERVLQVRLRKPDAHASSGAQPVYLPSVTTELAEDGIPPVLSPVVAERVLYARMQHECNANPQAPSQFDFLVGVWAHARAAVAPIRHLVAATMSSPNTTNNTNNLPADLIVRARQRIEDMASVQALAVSYAGLMLNADMIDAFPQNHDCGAGYLGQKLLKVYDPEAACPREFMNQFVVRFESDGLAEIIESTLKPIVAAMRTTSISRDHQIPIRNLAYLVSFKPIANCVALMPEWNPTYINARTIEVIPIFGPFLSRTGIFPDSDTTLPQTYFASAALSSFGSDARDDSGFSIGARNWADVRTAMTSLRDASHLVQASLHNILLSIIKASPEAKDHVLSFIAHVININTSRGKLQVDRAKVSTDGFMHNVLQLCLRLCDPIMDTRYSKVALIDLDYLVFSTRIEFGDVTRVLADKDTVEAHVSAWKAARGVDDFTTTTANFVTELFFLTLCMHHYGLLSTMRYYTSLLRELDEMRKQAAKYQSMRDSGAWANVQPYVRAANEEGLKRLQAEIDIFVGVKLTMDAALMDREALEYSLRFYNLVMAVVVRAVVGNRDRTKAVSWGYVLGGGSLDGVVDDQGKPVSMFPLPAISTGSSGPAGSSSSSSSASPPSVPSSPPPEYAILPEWIFDDICEFYLFVLRYKATMLEHMQLDELIGFCMIFLSNPTYIKNPYLKSKLVEILFFMTLPLYRTASGESLGRIDGVFATHSFAKQHLVRAILGFYVDVEQTGMSSQFYDKFNIRYNISQILKSIWTDLTHRRALAMIASRDAEFFVRFAALLMNDATYLLDESLSKLKEISHLQTELAQPVPEGVTTEDRQRRQEREGLLSQLERQATSYMSLGNETMHMLQYMTADKEIVQPFLAAEVVERLAAMLDYNLVALAGPRCTDLKVAHPERYRFEPKRLLSELVSVYLHLCHRDEFVTAVAKDGRSYQKAVFDRVVGILTRHRLKDEIEIQRLVDFVTAVETTLRSEQLREEEMGDIPDEFLDPLLYTLMEDPVILPSSGVSIDMSTIKSHLLSDTHDPFNRQPLTIDMVKPDEALKQRIREWKNERVRLRQGDGAKDMDTSG